MQPASFLCAKLRELAACSRSGVLSTVGGSVFVWRQLGSCATGSVALGGQAGDPVRTKIQNQRKLQEAVLCMLVSCSSVLDRVCMKIVSWMRAEKPLTTPGLTVQHRNFRRGSREWARERTALAHIRERTAIAHFTAGMRRMTINARSVQQQKQQQQQQESLQHVCKLKRLPHAQQPCSASYM